MAEFGLDGFLYEQKVDGKDAVFTFTDPEDVTNTAEISVAEKDFPDGALAGSRETADLAYAKVQKDLNDKRDARILKASQQAQKDQTEADAQVRESSNDFLANSFDTVVQTAGTEVRSDGVKQNVYNTEVLNEQSTNETKKKK